jgi:suppressor for copper-sensitivity B
MPNRIVAAVTAAAASLVFAGTSLAQTGVPPLDISTELVVGEVFTDGDPYSGWIGVRVRLGDGWKIYWKAPGDAGVPPEFDWSASSNLATATVQWPAPHRTSMLGVESIGYAGEVVFPVRIEVVDADFDTHVDLKLTLFACSTICVREERRLKADLSRLSYPDAQSLIDEWREKVPAERSASLAISSMEILHSKPPRLRVEATAAAPLRHPDLFVTSTPPGIYAARPDITVSDSRAVLTAVLQGEAADFLRPFDLAATLVDGPRAVEAMMSSGGSPAVLASVGATPADGERDSTSWWSVIAMAGVAGLILNLMPCVFPVLSLKLLSFVGNAQGGRREVRAGFLASAAGVVVSFLVLASALAALKAAGATVGWGIQFQQPLFLAAMAVVVALFAANLLGFFELALPSRLMNAIAGPRMRSPMVAQFANGFVSTLLATPCSAPFVGTAVGFALSRGSFEVYGVFAAMGVGMASPYLVAACVPGITTILPRPGPWMLWLRRAMAVPMLGMAAWLVSLVAATAGPVFASVMAAGLVIALLLLWHRAAHPSPHAIIAVSCALGLAGTSFLIAGARTADVSGTETVGIQWHRFGELDALVQSGHTVFLDITADWCVTCKVNKVVVVNDREIVRRLASDVVAVRADWTRPDPRIATYLKSFGRYGIPFNVVFGPDAPQGIVLPELLTRTAVLSAFAASTHSAQTNIEPK